MRVEPAIPLLQRSVVHGARTAIIDPESRYSYDQLRDAAHRVATSLLAGQRDLGEARVAYLVPPGFPHVAVQWGIWLAGGIAVPLCLSHPPAELAYVLQDTAAAMVIADPQYRDRLLGVAGKLGTRLLLTTEVFDARAGEVPRVDEKRRAMILYTSGTTSRPKGVVLTHRNLTAQITSLIEAWEWSSEDHILQVLPLHHTHGIVNVLCCALWAGAVCEMLTKFDAKEVWQRLLTGEVTLFMAVPTIYFRLIQEWEQASPARREVLSRACRKLRLVVSGSAALPVSLFEKWKSISGQALLERYGMTETGMALSNPLRGERRPGCVGQPLPGVSVRLVDEEQGREITEEGIPGEIQVKGPQVFLEYWQRPEATAKAFRDGWFCTGDMAVLQGGYFRILGRASIDIIKTGGYKVSALEIEETLRSHPAIQECAVVGVEDAEWGEQVCAAVVLQSGASLTLEELRDWARQRLAPYKLPRHLLLREELPRNAMGKVTKPEIRRLFTGHGGSPGPMSDGEGPSGHLPV